jgi:hypothetical protein
MSATNSIVFRPFFTLYREKTVVIARQETDLYAVIKLTKQSIKPRWIVSSFHSWQRREHRNQKIVGWVKIQFVQRTINVAGFLTQQIMLFAVGSIPLTQKIAKMQYQD